MLSPNHCVYSIGVTFDQLIDHSSANMYEPTGERHTATRVGVAVVSESCSGAYFGTEQSGFYPRTITRELELAENGSNPSQLETLSPIR